MPDIIRWVLKGHYQVGLERTLSGGSCAFTLTLWVVMCAMADFHWSELERNMRHSIAVVAPVKSDLHRANTPHEQVIVVQPRTTFCPTA